MSVEREDAPPDRDEAPPDREEVPADRHDAPPDREDGQRDRKRAQRDPNDQPDPGTPESEAPTPVAAVHEQPEQPAVRETTTDGRRSTEGRLARLHLRVGLLALARAELETMAADGILDIEAMADLAEARWRSGDLVGAGEAAQAHLGGGGDEILAHVVAAESLAAQGRTADARRHVTSVLERAGRDVETLFSGQPRSRVWPQGAGNATAEPTHEPAAEAATGPMRLPLPFEDAQPLAGDALSRRPLQPRAPQAVRAVDHDAGDELAAVRADLVAGRLAAVAARLSLLVRSEPRLAAPIVGLAEEALEHVDPDGLEAASLHLVRGDAYRLLGREIEAVAAFQGSRRPIGASVEPPVDEPEDHGGEADDHPGPEETT